MKINKYIYIITLVLMFSFINYEEVYSTEIVKGKKIVYITFDDGPSPGTTNEILNILKKNDTTATFFVVGSKMRENTEVIKKINDSGMSIMPHTDKNIYNSLYYNSKSYFNDLKECEKTIYNLTGKNKFTFIRIPGGSCNTIAKEEVLDEIKNNIINDGKYYIDWSVDCGDSNEVKSRVNFIESRLREYGGLYKVEVVLMNDFQNKLTTIGILQKTIDFYKERGYEFKNLDNIEQWEIDYLKSIDVINRVNSE